MVANMLSITGKKCLCDGISFLCVTLIASAGRLFNTDSKYNEKMSMPIIWAQWAQQWSDVSACHY
jgi:hypothetical protein